MWWLFRSVTGLALLASLMTACGSTGSDRLIFHFVRWDNTGITQPDSITQNSGDIDVIQDVCTTGTGGQVTLEPFSNTIINAVFRNEQGSDIRLDGYVTQIGDSRLNKQADLPFQGLSATVIGGRCSTGTLACGSDSDCAAQAQGTCAHGETTVGGILLFDVNGKLLIASLAQLHPDILGQSINVNVTFFGSDANQSFETTASYKVVFADYDNCKTTGGGA